MLVDFGKFSIDPKRIITVQESYGNKTNIRVLFRVGRETSALVVENSTVKKVTDKVNKVLLSMEKKK